MKKSPQVKWLSQPVDKDYGAADSFLQLLFDSKKARAWSKKLKRADLSEYFAKDIFRASGTQISEVQAFDWTKQHNEIAAGKALSPILLVRQGHGRPLIIADGFHRICAVFETDQEIAVPCKIV